MSATSKPYSHLDAPTNDEPIDPYLSRPFAADVLARAEIVIRRYRVTMWFEDGEFYGRGVELPGAGGDGPTPDACMADTREAMLTCAATMLERGEPLPTPVTEQEDAAFANR